MLPWISISSGVDGQGLVPCLSFPYLQKLGKPPNVSEDNFLELRGVNRENWLTLAPPRGPPPAGSGLLSPWVPPLAHPVPASPCMEEGQCWINMQGVNE